MRHQESNTQNVVAWDGEPCQVKCGIVSGDSLTDVGRFSAG